MRFIPKRKLRAATARRMPRAAMEDHAQEPSISFGKALIVMLVLHLVAVGGIYAFSSLKTRNIAQQPPLPRPVKETAAEPGETGDGGGAPLKTAQPEAQETQPAAKAPATPVVTHAKPATDANSTGQPASPPVKEATPTAKDSGAFYTVAKGDNPLSIARKLHVSYDDLLKLNKITDPKKLKIGQKLRIPAKKKPMPQT